MIGYYQCVSYTIYYVRIGALLQVLMKADMGLYIASSASLTGNMSVY